MNPCDKSGSDLVLKSIGEARSDSAFTRADLLVVVVIAMLWVLLLLPAFARSRPDSRVFQCLNNHGQLTRAWLMYAADNNERLATSDSGNIFAGIPVWAAGWLTWDTRTDNTNTAFLSNPQYSILANYFRRDARLFKCPADDYVSSAQRARGWLERVRSVGQNFYAANGNSGSTGFDPAYLQVTKLTGLSNPKPASTWISMDEHPDSINDGALIAPRTTEWIDVPANYHDGGTTVAFADGHTELRRWRGSLLNVPVRYVFTPVTAPPNDVDILWVRARTPRRPGAN